MRIRALCDRNSGELHHCTFLLVRGPYDVGLCCVRCSALQLRAQVLEDTRVDLTSRLAARIEENSALSRDLTLLRETVSQLENRAAAKELELLAAKENEVSATAAREQQAKAEQREENERRERIACTSQLVAIQSECAEKIREIDAKAAGTVDALRLDLAVAAHQQSEAQQERRRLENELIGKESQIRELNVALENAAGNPAAVLEVSLLKAQLQVLENEVVELRGNLAEAKQTIGDQIKLYEDKLVAGEVQRRKLHNLVQELRGNIRVYARVRPFLPKEQEKKEESCIAVKPDVNSLRILREPKADSDERLEDHSFTFDKVFAQSTSQEAVFAEVSEFVQSALDGYNVCLFSYGQTGSGKVLNEAILQLIQVIFAVDSSLDSHDAGSRQWVHARHYSSRDGASGRVQVAAGGQGLAVPDAGDVPRDLQRDHQGLAARGKRGLNQQ